jgi:hypothetical protein
MLPRTIRKAENFTNDSDWKFICKICAEVKYLSIMNLLHQHFLSGRSHRGGEHVESEATYGR